MEKGKTEALWMLLHNKMIGHLPLRELYAFTDVFVIPFCMLFSRQGYLAIYRPTFVGKNEKLWRAFLHTYLNLCKRFAEVILDTSIYAGGKFVTASGNRRALDLAKGRQFDTHETVNNAGAHSENNDSIRLYASGDRLSAKEKVF